MDETTTSRLAAVMTANVHTERTLSDESVEVGVIGLLDSEVAFANVVDSLVVNHETTVRVLECGVCGED